MVDVPAQKGLVECGIIVCEVARLAINNAPIYYDTSESAIRRMRSVIAYELLQGCILENNHRCTVDDVSYAAAKSGSAAIVLNFSLPRLMVVNLQPGDPEFASSTSVRVTLQSSPASADDVSSSPKSTDSDQTPEAPAEPVLECSGVAEPPNERHAEPNPEESELFICVPTTPKREMYR